MSTNWKDLRSYDGYLIEVVSIAKALQKGALSHSDAIVYNDETLMYGMCGYSLLKQGTIVCSSRVVKILEAHPFPKELGGVRRVGYRKWRFTNRTAGQVSGILEMHLKSLGYHSDCYDTTRETTERELHAHFERRRRGGIKPVIPNPYLEDEQEIEVEDTHNTLEMWESMDSDKSM